MLHTTGRTRLGRGPMSTNFDGGGGLSLVCSTMSFRSHWGGLCFAFPCADRGNDCWRWVADTISAADPTSEERQR